MKYFDWNELKNIKLKAKREVCFEDVLTALDEGKLLNDVLHPNQQQRKGQRVFIIEINNYVFLIPYVEDDERIFLKTIYPSRKFTCKYLPKRRQQ